MIDDRIEINPKKMGGKPVIKGTRIPVYFILELLANGWSFEDILESYPQLTKEDLNALLEGYKERRNHRYLSFTHLMK
ncbi:DUF433 domain-containing protein [Thermococcus guaymasensis]|nr:DUF433 domain-containing protein [Thermococcus guaymasensis]